MLKKQFLWLLLFMPLTMWGLTITEDTTLTKDMVYNEDVIVSGAILTLNNHTMRVNGDLNITNSNGRLQMTETDDKLIVTGNLTFAGASTYQDLTNGVIEVAGNFYQRGTETSYDHWSCSGGSTLNVTGCSARYRGNNAYAFYSMDKHKVILNGTSKQIVDFESGSSSRFNNLEIKNSSVDGVVFEELNVVGEWKRNSNSVTITDIRNLTLTENYTIPNDIEIINGTLNLNGFNLTINGSMNSKSARVNINNSTLLVENDLVFTSSNSRLQMTKLNDKVIVKGDLTFNGASTYQDLTNGVIELAGNFYQKGTETSYTHWRCSGGSTLNVTGCSARYRGNNAYAFYPMDKHKVILNGSTQQIIDFEAPDFSQFSNLEINNSNVDIDLESSKKIKIIGDLLTSKELYTSTYKDSEFITYGRYRDRNIVYMNLSRGLQLIALPVKSTINENQIKSIFSDVNISHVLKYDSEELRWRGYGNTDVARKKIAEYSVLPLDAIKAGEGFYVKAEGEVELEFPKDEGYDIEGMGVDELSSGWHLIGNNKMVKINSLLAKNRDIKVIRKRENSVDLYWSNDSDIQEEYRRRSIIKFDEHNATNSGFWVYVE
jgi:hypothetical protein